MSEDSSGFDVSAGTNWIYPSNLPVRDYQYNIVQHALFKNTLVCLPTGLGKTFIAAVVMYNFYRWYPQGKIVFMTPTRPLVTQQIDACYNVMGIPQEAMTEMTGTQQPASRAELWRTKRIFFLTAQVFMNDLARGACDGAAIKCLVIDEAHKAQKNHAYCQVVRELLRVHNQFRVLALSATPGNDIKDVQQVISNILISHVEVRSEESIDVQPYTHHKQVEKVIVTLDGNLSSIVDRYLKVCSVYISRLQENRVLYNQSPVNVTKFMLITARDKFRAEAANRPPAFVGRIEGDFCIAMSLYHGLELVQLHGPRSLYNFIQGILHGDKAGPRVRAEIMKNESLMELFNQLATQYDPNRAQPSEDPSGAALSADLHPKMKKLDEIVTKHFMDCQNNEVDGKSKETRVIVFAQYRDTVDEIKRLLERHRPLIKPVVFIGHGAASSEGGTKKGRGRGAKSNNKDGKNNQDENSNDAVPVPGRLAAVKMSQKEQLLIMERFRRGDFNTLVATSIVEEGLDIGEVDLIVCYDQHRSPIRLVQRMGRTGRKRDGRCVMLVTAGREDSAYEQGLRKKNNLIKSIENAKRTLQLYPQNPRMVPNDVKPQPLLTEVKVSPRTSTLISAGRGRGKGRGTTSKRGKTGRSNVPSAITEESSSKEDDNLPVFEEDPPDEDFKISGESNNFEPPLPPPQAQLETKPTTSKRKKKTNEPNPDVKQRKVYEYFAAPAAAKSGEVAAGDDDVVVVENIPGSNLACSLKNRLVAIVENGTMPGDETDKFNQLVKFGENSSSNNNKTEPITTGFYFRSPVSWDGFQVESFVKDVMSQMDEFDFAKGTQMFLSPPCPLKLSTAKKSLLFASTPKTEFMVPDAPKTASTPNKSNDLSVSSELGMTQALDLLSAASPAKTTSTIKPPTSSVVRNRYISPVIESLAAAYRRKQAQQKLPTINFDIGFDFGDDEQTDEKVDDNEKCPVNFDLEFDFSNIVDNVKEPLQTVEEQPEMLVKEELLDADLMQELASSPDPPNEVAVVEAKKEENAVVVVVEDSPILTSSTKKPKVEVSPFVAPPRPSSEMENNSPILMRRQGGGGKLVRNRLDDSSIIGTASSSKLGKYASFPQPTASTRSSIYFDDEDDDDDFKPTTSKKPNLNKHSTSSTKWVSKMTPNSSGEIKKAAKKPLPVKSQLSASPSESPIVKRKKKAKTKRNHGRMFLETQAEQSDTASSDDDNSDDDRDLSGFVDHSSHFSPINTQDHAMYLRMQIDDNHRTPQFNNGRFKLVYNQKPRNDTSIYSQTPGGKGAGGGGDDGDDYVEDSFCVRDDFVEFEESGNNHEDTLDLISPKFQPKTRAKNGKHKRMVVIDSDDEDEAPTTSREVDNQQDQEEIDLAIAICRSLEDSPPRKPSSSSFIPGPESPLILSQTAKRVKAETMMMKQQKIVIFASPRQILPQLQNNRSTCVVVRQSSLPGLDYVISCRLAATRVKFTDLLLPDGNGRRQVVMDEVENLASLVDLPVVIAELEEAGSNNNSETAANKSRVAQLFAQLFGTRLRVLYSTTQTTAAIIADLAKQEEVEGAAVCVNQSICDQLTTSGSSSNITSRMDSFISATGSSLAVTPIVALKMALEFKTVEDFLSSNDSSRSRVDLSKFSACARQALSVAYAAAQRLPINTGVSQADKVSSKQLINSSRFLK